MWTGKLAKSATAATKPAKSNIVYAPSVTIVNTRD